MRDAAEVLGDCAKPDDTDRRAGELASDDAAGLLPAAIGFDIGQGMPRRYHHGAQDPLGHRRHETAARLRYKYAGGAGRGDVDGADVHLVAQVGDQVRKTLEHLRISCRFAIGNDYRAIACGRDQFFDGHRAIERVEHHLADVAKGGQGPRTEPGVARLGEMGEEYANRERCHDPIRAVRRARRRAPLPAPSSLPA